MEDEERYQYLKQNEVGSVDSNGVVRTLQIIGVKTKGNLTGAIAIELEGVPYVPLHDELGNVVSILPLSGSKPVEVYRYSAFGMEQLYDGEGGALLSSINPWRYFGKRIDEESGLINFGERYYDSAQCRWINPDPIGVSGGANLYAYVKNSPLNYVDLFGLYGEQAHHASKSSGYTPANSSIKYQSILQSKARNGSVYDLRDMNAPELKRGYLTFINGMNNDWDYAKGNTVYFSKLTGGYNVHAVFNKTRGILKDIFRCEGELDDREQRKTVIALRGLWMDLHKRNPEFQILHYGHSEGVIITRNAFIGLPREVAEKIHVVAISPGAYIYRKMFGSVIHYRSRYDPIPRLDSEGEKNCGSPIITLDSHPQADNWDHSFNSPTFKRFIIKEAEQFIEQYGSK